MVSEQQAAAAIVQLRKIIEAAENANQAGEDAAVMAEAAPYMYEALKEILPCTGWWAYSDEDMRREAESGNGNAPIILKARAALRKARGEA